MTEIFFVLTMIYAAYVIFVVATEKKKPIIHSVDESAEALTHPTHYVPPLMPEKPMAQPLVKSATKAVKTAMVKTTGLKNPETGEISKSYANYRFMKRWIKEALVSENLLEKIYKNQELNPELEAKIKEAITSLENMERYSA
jgi:hypothetical protein